MRKSMRIALAGVVGGTILTVVPIVNPFAGHASTEHTETVGVARPSVSPFPTKGTVPVVTPSAKSSESASGAPKKHASKKTRARATPTPKASPSAVRSAPSKRATTTERVTYISGYRYCGKSASAAQPCINQGSLVLYYPAGVTTLAGHNYMGWSWMDDLPTGRKVVIKSGGLAGTYRVYGHGYSTNKMFPSNGYGASVALQTCAGKGIGFSFLRRI